MNLIAQLARVKAVFQQRAVAAIVTQPPVVDMADLIIATRALRVHNRSEAGAAAYREVHTNLKQGLRK